MDKRYYQTLKVAQEHVRDFINDGYELEFADTVNHRWKRRALRKGWMQIVVIYDPKIGKILISKNGKDIKDIQL